MKTKTHITIFLLSFLLAIPALSFADYNDVSLDSSAVITVAGVDLTVNGSSNAVESIVVNPNNFVVTLRPGSSLSVSSVGRNDMDFLITQAITYKFTCGDSDSTLAISSNASSGNDSVVTVSVHGNTCAYSRSGAPVVTSDSSSSSTSGGGGGGGNGPAIALTPQTPTIQTVQTSSGSGLSATQINSIISLLQSFGADQGVIDKVRASLTGTGTVNAGTATHYTFTLRLKLGSKGEDVRNLQKILNSDPSTQIAVSGAGSPGNETTLFGSMTRAAVERFQEKYNIAKAGDVGYGEVGPKTRAKLEEF